MENSSNPVEIIAHAMYESRGLGEPCMTGCVDHFEHDLSAEASECRRGAMVATEALRAAGFSLVPPPPPRTSDTDQLLALMGYRV